tara:strand:+ start:1844 stop:3856 length:2013 start_codon:yes stop_codon:yes gene_type:complete
MFQISTEYSIAWLIVCFIVAALFSYVLYRSSDFKKKWAILLSVLRFCTVFLLCFFLLKPVINLEIVEKEKPIIVFGIDNSASMLRASDSFFLQNQLIANLIEFSESNLNDFQFQTYVFGESTKLSQDPDFTNKKTNISQFIQEISDVYSGKNLSALVLVSDGLYNYGKNPNYINFDVNCPVYTLAIGDTAKNKDLKINHVFNNDLAFLGNMFPINVSVQSQFFQDKKTKINLFKEGKLLDSKDVFFQNLDETKTIFFNVLADKKGIQEYQISITPFEEEKNTENNNSTVYIEVLESKQKLLLISDIVHPDISAISKAISSNDNYELTISTKDGFDGSYSDYNLIIAYQTNIEFSDVPVWYFYGESSSASTLDWFTFNKSTLIEEASPVFNDFSLFSLSEDWDVWLKQLPPIYVPQGNYSSSGQSIFTQSLKSIELEKPLFVFSNETGVRQSVFIGEGIWRWRLYEYKQNKNHLLFDELIQKSIQYLVLKDDKRPFRLKVKNKIYNNENLLLELDLYDSNYDLVNDVDVSLVLKDESNNEFDFLFDKNQNSYELNIDKLEVGNYTYTAQAKRGTNSYKQEGSLKVIPLKLEFLDDQNNHEVLQELSNKNNGKFFYLNQLSFLLEELRNLEKTSVLYTKKIFTELIHSKWISVLLFVFLSLEWIIRKINNNI